MRTDTCTQNPYGFAATNTLALTLYTNVVLQYDANGNLTNDGTRVFSYDAENQLTNVFATNAWRVGFVYDGLNRRRITREYTWQSTNWVETNETRFIYDGMLVLQERDTNNNSLVTYTRGLDLSLSRHGAGGIGGLLARTDTNASTYYHADGSGNITALIDGYQNIVARYRYDAYGKLLGRWGTLADANTYRFSSKEQDPSGLYYYGFRFYEPNFQRWLNHDLMAATLGLRLNGHRMPVESFFGPNLYAFVYNNPGRYVDPNGLWGIQFGNFNFGYGNPNYAFDLDHVEEDIEAGLKNAFYPDAPVRPPDADGITPADGDLLLFVAPFLPESGAGDLLSKDAPKPSVKCPAKATQTPKAAPLTADQAKRINDAFAKGLDEKFRTGGGVDEMRQVLKENGLTDEQIADIFKGVNQYIKR